MELKQKIKVIYEEQKLLAKMDLKEEVFFKKMAIYRSLVTLNFFFHLSFHKKKNNLKKKNLMSSFFKSVYHFWLVVNCICYG